MLAFFLPFIAHAQPFPLNDASWEGVSYNIAGPQPFREYLCGDTLISGRAYSKFYQLYEDTTLYEAAIRTSGEQVYAVRPGESEEVLLYDFSLEPGDEISLEYFRLPGSINLKVGSVITVTQQQTTRKVINFVPVAGFQETWVEGVGALSGPLNRALLISDQYSELHCYQEEGSLAYRTSAAEDCTFYYECLLTSTGRTETEKRVQVYPTVSRGQFWIDNQTQKPLSAELMDQNGRLMAQLPLLSEGRQAMQFDLPPGIYYLKLWERDKKLYLQHFKLIIVR